MKKIAIIGATGLTGRLTCERLLGQGGGAREFRLVLAGRDRNELERMSIDLGRRFKQPLDVSVFEFSDRSALRTLVESSVVAVNCAAPYAISGPPVLATAVNGKVCLIDAASEVGYVEQCSVRAAVVKEAGIAVVNGLAVEPGVAELALTKAAEGWEAVNSVRVLYVYHDLDETPGFRASVFENLKQPCRALVERSLQATRIAAVKHTFKWSGGQMAAKNTPGCEALVIPRAVGGLRNVTTFHSLTGKAGLMHALLGSPFASLAMMALDRWATSKTERPVSDRSRFVVVVEIEGVKNRRFAIVQGSGIYQTTANLLASAAVKLAAGERKTSGVLAPSQAFDASALLEAAGLEVMIADPA